MRGTYVTSGLTVIARVKNLPFPLSVNTSEAVHYLTRSVKSPLSDVILAFN